MQLEPEKELVGELNGQPVYRMPAGWVPPGAEIPTQEKPGLGDRIQKLLATVGITEQRYKEAKRLLNFAPTCGCPARIYFLNKLLPRLSIAFAKGGKAAAWNALHDLIEETNEKFPQPAET